jgi:hypothetical protein
MSLGWVGRGSGESGVQIRFVCCVCGEGFRLLRRRRGDGDGFSGVSR